MSTDTTDTDTDASNATDVHCSTTDADADPATDGREAHADLAAETWMTRTAASVLELDRRGAYDGAAAVVGNAPTADRTVSSEPADSDTGAP